MKLSIGTPSPFANIKNTFPNEKAISTYSTVHAGPKSQAGGAQNGFIRVEYQLYISIKFIKKAVCVQKNLNRFFQKFVGLAAFLADPPSDWTISCFSLPHFIRNFLCFQK